ncbi:MAG: hypothetical protein MZV70_57545 [Desulfobacterales bacterium]|nr:hypothetical protein [Desulfobacterales bacterium]
MAWTSRAGGFRRSIHAGRSCSAMATAGISPSCLDTLRTGNRLGLNVFVFDYRGYGNSDGSPSEQGTYGMEKRPGITLSQQGRSHRRRLSYGDGPSAGRLPPGLLVRHPAGVLIVESAFTSRQGSCQRSIFMGSFMGHGRLSL